MAKRKIKTNELHGEDITPQVPQNQPSETELIGQLFQYADEQHNPWRKDFVKTAIECFQFVELNQWESADMKLLNLSGIPTIAVDRIGRARDIVKGIRENTGNKKKIVKRELGDDRVAEMLDCTADYVSYNGNFEEIADESYDSMLDVGIGIRKVGYDPSASGGQGEIFAEFVKPEDCGWSKCKSKELEDANVVWERRLMDWEEAMLINPDKAPILKGIKAKLTSEWDKQKTGNNKGLFARDYENLVVTHAEGAYAWPDQVEVWEFWIKHRLPMRKIGSVSVMADPMGNITPVPQVRLEAIDYTPVEGEQHLASVIQETWEQYVIASSGGKANAIILKQQVSDLPFHPYVGMCAVRKKSGAPFGFVEKLLPHQKRINISWAQKTAWNNKAIKAPIVAQKGSIDLESGIQASALGAFLFYETGYNPPTLNQVPPANIQAIEEGNVARMDMDFAAASSEPAMTGQAQNSSSGIKLSLQQNAAVTPLNQWTKAEKLSELLFWRKVLHLIITKFPTVRIARIIGEQKFQELAIGKLDPMTGQPLQQPIQFVQGSDGTLHLPLETEHYDVVIQDTALSDFNRQQTFNAIEAMVAQNVPFDDKYRIRNAPIKDVDGALASNEQARNDIIQKMQMVIQQLQAELQQTQSDMQAQQKLIPPEKRPPNRAPIQKGNAAKGKSQPQAGRQSMLAGTGPSSPLGVM